MTRPASKYPQNAQKVLDYLKEHDGTQTSWLGDVVWPEAMGQANAPMARPAGKLLKRMEREGLVRREQRKDVDTTLWYLTEKGRHAVLYYATDAEQR